MKVAVIGGQGQLGSDVAEAFARAGHEVVPLTHTEIEISNADSVASTLRAVHPGLIVNTAAMHHVEKCEQDPTLAFAINSLGPKNLAAVAQDLRAVLIHVSTDYVFNGKKSSPYREEDCPCPLNTYGNTKLAGEHYARTTDRHFVLRTSGLYGKHPCRGKGGLNFVELMLKLGRERGKVRVVATEEVTPTSTFDLAQQMVLLSRTDSFGLYHATAEGSCTWYEFAKEIFKLAGVAVDVQVADPMEFPMKVPRPQYSVLENAVLKSRSLNYFNSWQAGLRCYLGVTSSKTLAVSVAS